MMENNSAISRDPLTGLYSRWYMYQQLQQIIASGQNRVFVNIDVDGFHTVNDQYGSQTGDRLLQAIANVLTEAYPDAVVCRVAVDEFAFLLAPTTYSRYQMSQMTHHFYSLLHSIRVPADNQRIYTFSLGSVFIDPQHHTTPDSVFAEAQMHSRVAKGHEGTYLRSFYGNIPDIGGSFLILRQDRIQYNDINNRLSSIQNRQDWVDYLRKGAELKGNMCQRNQNQLDDILAYYANDDLPDFDYEQLFQQVIYYARSLDAFMVENLIEGILLPYYEKCDRSDISVRSHLGHLYLMMVDSLFAVYRMGDEAQRVRIVDYLHRSMDVARGLPHDSIQFEPYFFSLCHLVGHFESLNLQLADVEECDQSYEELRGLLLGPDPVRLPDPEVERYFEYLVNNARLFPLFRACFLRLRRREQTAEEAQEYQRRLEYIRQHLVDGVFDMAGSNPAYRRMARFLQGILLDDGSVDDILRRLTTGLGAVHKQKYGSLSQSNIVVVAYLFLGASRALEYSELPADEKRRIGVRGVSFLVELMRKRESIASDPQLLFLVQTLMRAMLHSSVITPADKLYFLEQAMGAIMLDTYCHSRVVAAYAKIILTNIIDHHPDMLVGEGRPYLSQSHLEANRKSLLEFMDCACMLHDVGKMTLSPITSNSYRRLSDREFHLLHRHPEFGVDLLRLEPAFEPFLPFVLEHHRWWTGESGYPKLAPGAHHSSLKVLVDILSLCDSLEAATSRIGRNYRKPKNFLEIMDEFLTMSGTRYNAKVVQSIIGSPETYYKLRQMVDTHWQDVYHSIYHHVYVAPHETPDPSSDRQFPTLYRYQPASENIMSADTVLANLHLPDWLRQMDHEQLLLMSYSLNERNRLEVQQHGNIIFFYDVAADRVGIIMRDEDGSCELRFLNHYSDSRNIEIVSDAGYSRILEMLKLVLTEPGYPKNGEFKIEHRDQSRNLLLSYSSILDSQGRVISIVGHVEDVNTSTPRLLQTIQLQNRHLEMFDSLVSRYLTVVYTDVTLATVEVVQAPPTLRAPLSRCTTGQEIVDFVSTHLIDADQRQSFLDFCDIPSLDQRLNGQSCITREFHSSLSGWMHAHILPVDYDENHRVRHLLFATESVETEHEQLEFLARVAHYDSLTGIYTRRRGEELIAERIVAGGPQILALLDCDNFKRINDELSHLVGDKVLREVGHAIRDVFPNQVAMRLGGDEFVIHICGDDALRLINSFSGVRSVFERLASRVGTIRIPELEGIAPTLSCGVVYSDGSVLETSFDAFYHYADMALHRSKRYRNGTITTDELTYRDYYR